MEKHPIGTHDLIHMLMREAVGNLTHDVGGIVWMRCSVSSADCRLFVAHTYARKHVNEDSCAS
jgi:hypothetical protein